MRVWVRAIRFFLVSFFLSLSNNASNKCLTAKPFAYCYVLGKYIVTGTTYTVLCLCVCMFMYMYAYAHTN